MKGGGGLSGAVAREWGGGGAGARRSPGGEAERKRPPREGVGKEGKVGRGGGKKRRRRRRRVRGGERRFGGGPESQCRGGGGGSVVGENCEGGRWCAGVGSGGRGGFSTTTGGPRKFSVRRGGVWGWKGEIGGCWACGGGGVGGKEMGMLEGARGGRREREKRERERNFSGWGLCVVWGCLGSGGWGGGGGGGGWCSPVGGPREEKEALGRREICVRMCGESLRESSGGGEEVCASTAIHREGLRVLDAREGRQTSMS